MCPIHGSVCGGNCPYLHSAMNDIGIGMAPIVRQTEAETVFAGAGNSHFSYVSGEGFHVTTQIPDLGQGLPISIHDRLK